MSIGRSRPFVIWRGHMAEAEWDIEIDYEEPNLAHCTATRVLHDDNTRGRATVKKEFFVRVYQDKLVVYEAIDPDAASMNLVAAPWPTGEA